MESAMSTGSLIFIPDISGYTDFIHSTEIQHAKHIIEEVLEAILSANAMGLELSEVEGDALLLYRKGKPPTCQELLDQIRGMYIEFHAHLKKYETQRICSCGACCSTHNLQLKFVAHYGELSETLINNRTGLFGKAVIVAHRLLKNQVDSDEYALISDALSSACPTWSRFDDVAWDTVVQQEDQYDFGTAKYRYVELKNLAHQVPEPKLEDYSIPGADKMLVSTEGTLDAPIDLVFDVVSDLYYRHNYIVGQVGNDRQNHKIFQNGSIHRCLMNNPMIVPIYVTHDYVFDQNKITFVETDKKNGMATVWNLKATSRMTTHIQLATFMKPSRWKVGLFNLLLKKRVAKTVAASFEQLNAYCKKLLAENKRHPNRIVLPKTVSPMT